MTGLDPADCGVTLLRLAVGGGVLWLLPWWWASPMLWPHDGGASRVSRAFLLGVIVNVCSAYCLIVMGAYTPARGVAVHLCLAALLMVASARRAKTLRRESHHAWALILAMAGALALRLPEPCSHLSLGGNDPWGHLVLCKALASGDPIAGFHAFSFYPRGYHAMVLSLSALSGVPVYDVMRLFGPVLSLLGVVGAYAVASRVSSQFGGLVASFAYAVPAYRHLVLPSLQTALEPDRFAFVFLPALLLLLLDVIERDSKRSMVILLLGEMVHVLVHPLSVQFMAGWIVCGGIAVVIYGNRRIGATVLAAAGVIVLFSWAYFFVMHHSFGIVAMSHLAPRATFTVGGHGVDFHRVLLGTGWTLEPMDGISVALAISLLLVGARRRSPAILVVGLVLAHSTYAAVRDALYLGDYGHAPPYYAMAFAWAAGAAAGARRLTDARRLLPAVGLVALFGHHIVSHRPMSPIHVFLYAACGASAVGVFVIPRLRDGFVALFLGLALFSLRPQPVRYAHLGYPEAVRWALGSLAEPSGEVFSSGLVSRLPDGTPFPTQDPVRAIVWPHHRSLDLGTLASLPPDHRWPHGSPVLVMVETMPYQWQFRYFAGVERAAIMERARSWLAERRRLNAPVQTVESTGRMMLLALQDSEDGC